ncbi:MAG TPA: 50S ribosomal protein L13 [Kiritimatiellia bacterium]|nr:50S ribosomal protein L13 [Kiritimatiellia bacterium]HRZ12670.1 50S ribosomal protein L13 [Kiritimatiellia bacterium]HSA19562.1 50S ribosomal protein L13 [Kiritimatiellia bacterium]
MKTTLVRESEVVRAWHVVDAAGQPAGRLAVKIANILRGRNKRNYTPHADMGDFVVVINAAQVKLTGSKEEQKIYKDYSGYPSGLKMQKASVIRVRQPTRIVRQAVKGMLPKNHLSRKLITRLKVYAGAEHPHAAQGAKALAV